MAQVDGAAEEIAVGRDHDVEPAGSRRRRGLRVGGGRLGLIRLGLA